MPLLVSLPGVTPPGSVCEDIVTNVDVAPTLLELAGAPLPERLQGYSMVPSLAGQAPVHRQESVYYRYWEHDSEPHHVPAHVGVRTDRYKLICYLDRAWADGGAPSSVELYDLASDAAELRNVWGEPGYAGIGAELAELLRRRQVELGDTDLIGLPS